MNFWCGVVEIPAIAQMDTLDDLRCTTELLLGTANCNLFTATLYSWAFRQSHKRGESQEESAVVKYIEPELKQPWQDLSSSTTFSKCNMTTQIRS